ncbi:MAG: hypothetical protein AB1752_00895, partial [Candidatus Zixiibacteriota bacterium]
MTAVSVVPREPVIARSEATKQSRGIDTAAAWAWIGIASLVVPLARDSRLAMTAVSVVPREPVIARSEATKQSRGIDTAAGWAWIG